ncbi:MAG TPA: PEP-CTERM sorting domain-containing protein [Caldimonas sp.]|nr:PEP-CTERM sorting domain-containing protein [Caldimonas sp.]
MQRPSMSRAIVGAAAMLLVGAVHANLVTNGGFETGNLTGWSLTGNTSFIGVQCPGPSSAVQSGNCSGFFGPVGSLGGIAQTLATVAGATYDISFWLSSDGGIPSQFVFNWDGGAPELSLSNMPASGFVQETFHLAASSTNTSLSFSFRDDPGFIYLDTVSVTQVPEPGTLALAVLALGGLAATRRRKQ